MSVDRSAEHIERERTRLDWAVWECHKLHEQHRLERRRFIKRGSAGACSCIGGFILGRLGAPIYVEASLAVLGGATVAHTLLGYFAFKDAHTIQLQDSLEFADRLARSVGDLRDVTIGRKVRRLGRDPSLVTRQINDNVLQ